MDKSIVETLFEQATDQVTGLLKALGLIGFLGGLPGVLFLLFVLVAISIAVYDVFQRHHTIRRNFPLIGIFRYALETVGPELRQYIFTDDRGDRPIPRYLRSWIYASSKKQLSTVPFGTRKDLDKPGTILIRHSAFPVLDESKHCDRIVIGERTKNPYKANLFNISAMSFGSLGRNAVLALSKGAKEAGCFMNTGEGGLSDYHLEGGADICWQLGTAKFGARKANGDFDAELFKTKAAHPHVKLIELKLSQGAKPGGGGVLPAPKVTPEIARARGVEPWKAIYSPSRHKEWESVREMLEWIEKLRPLCEKPLGIKFCVGQPDFVEELCAEMAKTGLLLDFITVDGAEGGTGAAPLGMTDYLGYPAQDAIMLVDNALRRHGLREKVRVIASGKFFTGAQLAIAIALGADMANSARGFMLSIGCIHALRCNSNHCPAGVTTHSPWLQRGLIPEVKAPRAAGYHYAVMEEFNKILHACGYTDSRQLKRSDLMKVVSFNKIVSMDELVPQEPMKKAG
ncbi:MAG: FMN-binding glutamate synthase family protein [Bdellovibrionota bacterium]